MIAAVRSTAFAALLGAVALAGAACAPTSGPLGSPATPAVSPGPSDEPAPSDVAPESASPGAAPSAAPTQAPSGSPDASSSPSAAPSSAPTPTPAPAGTTIVRAYFILGSLTGNEGLVPVLREVPGTRAVASAAMEALLGGPKGAELDGSPAMSTAIPDGTELLGVAIKNGVATVDLSGEFATGGGTYSVMARLAQVTYTLTQFSTVDKVSFKLDGVPVKTFSSEGVILDGPVSRADYRDFLPAIFLDRPAWGAAAANPARISGLANVFEASFRVQIRDAKGGLIADQQVMATCGTGCWGTFKQDVAYTVAKGQYGTIRVFEPSAKDGSPINVTEYRVWLTP